MRRLKDLLEHGGVKILTPQDVLFAWLLDLDDDGDDEEDEDNAAGDTNDGPVGVVQVVQDAGFPVFCSGVNAQRKKEKQTGKMTIQASTEKERCSLLKTDNTREKFTVAVYPLPHQEQ